MSCRRASSGMRREAGVDEEKKSVRHDTKIEEHLQSLLGPKSVRLGTGEDRLEWAVPRAVTR